MIRIANETAESKNRLIDTLARKYEYDPWRVRIFDMQRASLRMVDPPEALLPEELKEHFQFATLTLQANGFVFTSSDSSPNGSPQEQISSPYTLKMQPMSGESCNLLLHYRDQLVDDFDSLRLIEIMGKPSTFYFPFRNRSDGRIIHNYLVLNPYENCAYRCKYCSRLPYFKFEAPDYRSNIQNTIRAVLRQVSSPAEVRYISVITGSMPSAEADLILMKDIRTAFDQAGFEHCEYGFYSSNIHQRADLETLRQMGVVFLTVTLETTSDAARQRLHSRRNPKHKRGFEDTLELIRQAEEIFPFVNTTLMQGYEPAEVLKHNLSVLARKTSTSVNHYIPRIWTRYQYELLDPSACNLEYYVDLCAFIEREINVGRKTIGAFFEQRFGFEQFKMRYRS